MYNIVSHDDIWLILHNIASYINTWFIFCHMIQYADISINNVHNSFVCWHIVDIAQYGFVYRYMVSKCTCGYCFCYAVQIHVSVYGSSLSSRCAVWFHTLTYSFVICNMFFIFPSYLYCVVCFIKHLRHDMFCKKCFHYGLHGKAKFTKSEVKL